jgi:ubiquinone/menaquinone biosynthesis C-methylase UbiE
MVERIELAAERQAAHAAELEERVQRLVRARGDERALDVGTGLGALALALAPHVREVVAVDVDAERLARARASAPANVEYLAGDGRKLPFDDASFDLTGTLRTLHHVDLPEYVLSEIARVTRPGGTILVVDQLAPLDPLEALALDRFERSRDPTHARLLPDGDFRQLFEANGLKLLRAEREAESRDLAPYLDLAGCGGEARERALALAPHGAERYRAEIGWYLLRR